MTLEATTHIQVRLRQPGAPRQTNAVGDAPKISMHGQEKMSSEFRGF
jgi:hypothetical protein